MSNETSILLWCFEQLSSPVPFRKWEINCKHSIFSLRLSLGRLILLIYFTRLIKIVSVVWSLFSTFCAISISIICFFFFGSNCNICLFRHWERKKHFGIVVRKVSRKASLHDDGSILEIDSHAVAYNIFFYILKTLILFHFFFLAISLFVTSHIISFVFESILSVVSTQFICFFFFCFIWLDMA